MPQCYLQLDRAVNLENKPAQAEIRLTADVDLDDSHNAAHGEVIPLCGRNKIVSELASTAAAREALVRADAQQTGPESHWTSSAAKALPLLTLTAPSNPSATALHYPNRHPSSRSQRGGAAQPRRSGCPRPSCLAQTSGRTDPHGNLRSCGHSSRLTAYARSEHGATHID